MARQFVAQMPFIKVIRSFERGGITDFHKCKNGRSRGGYSEAGVLFGRYARGAHRPAAALADKFQV